MKRLLFLLPIFALPILLLLALVTLLTDTRPVYAATITVDTTTDGNDGECVIDCSLREAIDVAIAGDIVDVPAGTHLLTLGQITLNENLTIMGAGPANTIIDGNTSDRIFDVTSGSTLQIDNLQITNGTAANGGGIHVTSGDLTLNNVQLIANSANFGGGLYINDGSATLNSGEIVSNAVTFDGGGVYVNTASATFDLVGGTIGYHTIGDDGGGLFINDGSATIQGGAIIQNTADQGAGVYINDGSAVMNGGQVNNNLATVASDPAGAGVYINNGLFTLNNGEIAYNLVPISNNDFPGSGVTVFTGHADLNGGMIHNNESHRGSGLMISSGTAYLAGTAIMSNTSTYGGGVYIRNSSAVLSQTGGIIASNISTATWDYGGGGIYIFFGTFVATGGEISYNHANYNGGGFHVARGLALVDSLTMRGNTADNRGGATMVRDDSGRITMTNSLLDGNMPDTIGTRFGGNRTTAIMGSTIINSPVPFDKLTATSSTIIAYANNIMSYTQGISGTVRTADYFRHNWWGEGATAVTVGDADAFDYRLGAPMVDWSDQGMVTDTGNARPASISAETGTGRGVIVTHGRGTPAVPFDKELYPTICSDYYDFFVYNGSAGSTWDVTVPVDATTGCETNTAGGTVPTNQLHMFALTGGNAPDTSCTVAPNTCWLLYPTITRTGGSGTYALTAEDVIVDGLGATPFATGDDGTPTAISLVGLSLSSTPTSIALIGLFGLFFLASALILRKSRVK